MKRKSFDPEPLWPVIAAAAIVAAYFYIILFSIITQP